MKILDRYILRTFLFSFLVVLTAVLGMAVTLDLVINLDEFTEEGISQVEQGFGHLLFVVCRYYFYKTFFYFQQLAGTVLLVAAAITLARFNKTNELAAIKASGVSVYRVMWPILLCALAFNGLFLINQEYVIPSFAAQLIRDADDLDASEVFPVRYIRDDNNNLIFAPSYIPSEQTMVSGPSVTDKKTGLPIPSARPMIILRNADNHLIGYIVADKATWDRKRKSWRLLNGRQFASMKAAAPLGRPTAAPPSKKREFYQTNIGPHQIERQRSPIFYTFLSYSEVKQLSLNKNRGNWRELAVAMHKHFAKPILNLVLLLLGLPFVVGKEGKSYVVSILLCLGIVLAFFATEYAITEFGNAGHIAPALAAWLPVFIFSLIGAFTLDSIRT